MNQRQKIKKIINYLNLETLMTLAEIVITNIKINFVSLGTRDITPTTALCLMLC
jgi:hypothetical protein